MPREPQGPRYRAERDAWVCKVDGSLKTFAKGKSNKAEANREFRRFMAERDERKARGPAPEVPTLGALVARFLDDLKARTIRGEVGARTFDDYDNRVTAFVRENAATPADEVSPSDLDAFLDGQTWGPNRRTDFVRVLGTIYRWGKARGLIACDPPRPTRPTGRKLKRDKIPEWLEVERVLAAIRSPRFRDFARFVSLTGCRPSEAASIEARHAEGDAIVLTEHKTRRKTGAPRVIVLNAAAREIVARLSAAHPQGPIFRNRDGMPWNRSSWRLAFNRARSKAGVDPKVSLYTFRHARATELLVATGDLPGVAAILGNDPTVTARTYSDVVNRRDHLRSLAERALGGTPQADPPSAAPGTSAGGEPATTGEGDPPAGEAPETPRDTPGGPPP